MIYAMHVQTWRKKKKLIGKSRKEEFISLLEPFKSKDGSWIVLFLGAEEKTVQALHGN